ncbi:MAG: hypothetical protein KA175_09825 [Flavobacteriales bacterium]|nr:hypothetical protein [Flavobacteriales bacterium]MBP6697905.1 hypothetical protein [Flavobacteriales bacterium]
MDLLGYLSVMAMSIVKFFFSALYSYQFGNTYLETVLLTGAGGAIGMLVFYFTGTRVLEWFRLRYLRRAALAKARGQQPKRIFTRTNRGIVRIKHGYGMIGLAAIAPPILSVPITAILAAKYFRHDRRTLPFLIGSVVLWSFVLSAGWLFSR